MGKTREEMFEEFGNSAGFVGVLHTGQGEASLYSIQFMNQTIYASDTRSLFLAYLKAHYHAPDGLYYVSESCYTGD